MIRAQQSIPGRYRQPASILALLGLLAASAIVTLPRALLAQASSRTISADTDLLKELGGPTILARLLKGSTVLAGSAKNGWAEVTVEGWIAGGASRADKREGFDIAVIPTTGTPIRAGAGTGATVATAKVGALFNRIGAKGAWVQVRRTGWVAADRLVAIGTQSASATKAAPSQPKSEDQSSNPAPTTVPAIGTPDGTLVGGTALFNQPGGTQIGVFATPFSGKVMEQRDGWSKVQLELWVRDEALGKAGNTTGLTAAAIRADPDKYLGQTVEWTLQVLALQKADELRPELPLGQPYVLARGPLPEAGLVYLVIPAAEVEHFASLEPLARIRVQATVRAGRARHLPTPVLDFVRRIN